jgi:hypothetical protein
LPATRWLGRTIRPSAVVGDQALDGHAQGRVVSHGGLQERHGRALALVVVHLHEARSRVIVDGHVSELPACASRGIATIACHTVAGLHDAPELLGVDVQQLAGRLSLVANDGRNGVERLQAGQPQACEQATDRGHAAPDDGGDAAHGHARAAQLLDALVQCGVQVRARRAGRELRSCKPCTPPSRKRLSHLRAVRGLMPAASAAGISPIPAMRSTSNLRPSNVNLAFLWLFIRWDSSVTLKRGNSSFPDPFG